MSQMGTGRHTAVVSSLFKVVALPDPTMSDWLGVALPRHTLRSDGRVGSWLETGQGSGVPGGTKCTAGYTHYQREQARS